jgi:glycosyltransferase involved in cell wall biosynthesis
VTSHPPTDRALRLAIMGTRGIPGTYGGFETFAEELSTRLAARGHEVTVYCRSHHAVSSEPVYRGVRLITLPSLRTKHLDTVVHTLLSTLDGLARGFDAVLICNSANAFCAWVPRLGGARVLLNVDGIEWQRKKWGRLGRLWYRLGERLATRCPNAIVSDAEVIRSYYREKYGRGSFCIPYGAPDTRVATRGALDRFNLRPGGYFLYVSRLEPENNAHVVIEAYRRVATDLPLVVVGDAPYAADYIRGLKKAADPRVVFTGFVFGEGYRELQSHCFAYVQATEVGGTHPALIEGMGMAAAVVANDTPENREAAGDGALFYRRNDPESLAGILRDLLAVPGSREPLRERALAIVRSRYSWERITDRYEAAIRDLLAGIRPV